MADVAAKRLSFSLSLSLSFSLWDSKGVTNLLAKFTGSLFRSNPKDRARPSGDGQRKCEREARSRQREKRGVEGGGGQAEATGR